MGLRIHKTLSWAVKLDKVFEDPDELLTRQQLLDWYNLEKVAPFLDSKLHFFEDLFLKALKAKRGFLSQTLEEMSFLRVLDVTKPKWHRHDDDMDYLEAKDTQGLEDRIDWQGIVHPYCHWVRPPHVEAFEFKESPDPWWEQPEHGFPLTAFQNGFVHESQFRGLGLFHDLPEGLLEHIKLWRPEIPGAIVAAAVFMCEKHPEQLGDTRAFIESLRPCIITYWS